MVCTKCKSENVNVTSEQVGGSTSIKKMSIIGWLGYWTLALCTAFLLCLFWRPWGSSKTKIKNQTVAICQSCGNKWKV